MDIAHAIKKIDWDIKVRREGFLQSKQIVVQAECLPLKIAGSVLIESKNQLWVREMNLYGLDILEELPEKFNQAYEKDKNWPAKIIKDFEKIIDECKIFIGKLKKNNFTKDEHSMLFRQYVKSLLSVQRYYIIAAPLADYCEKKLQEKSPALLAYAYPIKKLDLDDFNRSLESIRNAGGSRKKLLKRAHLKRFQWIKSSYNIPVKYTEKDLEEESGSSGVAGRNVHGKCRKENYLLRGLQSGIFLRNRIKEVSQQLWFAVEPLAKSIADSFSIGRNDFFQMTAEEVVKRLEDRKNKVSENEIKKRKTGFIVGVLNGKKFLLTGKSVEAVRKFYDKIGITDSKILKGSTACKGKIVGRVRVVNNNNDFKKFRNREILVASMTTPDYITLIKKAAAIVTDEGGLSCHAAIVARELKKPCIIGTKIATKVLKDGDSVEVDADKGVVRLIKKAN